LPRQPKPPVPHLQPVADTPFPLDIPEEDKAIVMAERELTIIAYRQLQNSVHYCLPRDDKPLEGDEALHNTDPDLRVWIDDDLKQKLNATMFLENGVVEARFFGPDQSLNACFFAACDKLNLSPRYAIGRRSREWATSVLFKLRDDEAKRFDEEYSSFKPKPFTLDDARRGVVFNYAPPAKKGSNAHKVTTLAPGSLLWHGNGVDYDLFVWRSETGQGHAARWRTDPPQVEFFSLVRAAAFAAILNIVPTTKWRSAPTRWSFSEWLARVVRDGQAINANVVFAKASRAIIADPAHAETLIELICNGKSLPETREECLVKFRLARTRLEADPTRHDVAGWSVIKQWLGDEAHNALRTVLNVGADSTLLETFAARYLFCEGEFIDRDAFREGREQFVFSKDMLTLQHAPDQIQTKKRPVKAFPIFIESKMRQDVTGIEIHPDQPPGAILRVTRQGAIVADDDYAPEHSRLVFNEWRGLYVQPAKTIDHALRAECEEKLNHMLGLVTNHHKARAAWIKAHFGWTLKHPGQKQQVALVCTGDQSTGKTFLCQDFAEAVFDKYAGKGSLKAFEGQFYIPSYTKRLWVNHDEVVSKPEIIEVIKDLIRSTKISGQFKNKDARVHISYARLAFTSNEVNPGLSRGADRGIFQVTSITAAKMGLLPTQFQDQVVTAEIKPFYKDFAAFLKRDEVRQAYVKLLIDCAPDEIAEVEDLTHSAVRDDDVAVEQLTHAQLIAKEILEDGTIHSGFDIAMPFRAHNMTARVKRANGDMGFRPAVLPDAVLAVYFHAGLLRNLPSGEFLFKFKIGALQRLFGEIFHVPMRSHWKLEKNDDMPNDWRDGDPMEPWKGRVKNEEERRTYQTRRYQGDE
jgi:hypothetical protein